MENFSQSATAPPSITSILKRISNDKALVVFNSIAVSSKNDRYIPLKENEYDYKAILFKDFWFDRCWLD
jgi:hypothetical protein